MRVILSEFTLANFKLLRMVMATSVEPQLNDLLSLLKGSPVLIVIIKNYQ